MPTTVARLIAMRIFALFLLITLLVPRLADDTSVHVAVCLTAAQQQDGHEHAHHAQMQHENVTAKSTGNDFQCRHCGDCGVHVGAALTPVMLSHVGITPSTPSVTRDPVHPISRPSQLIRPPLV